MKKSVLGLLVLSLVLCGCGYHFRGGQNNLPADVKTIAIPVFGNNTAEVRIENTFTDEVIFQFTRSQMVRVVPEGEADAVLYGTIQTVDITDVAYTSDDTSKERRVRITVSAKLVRSRDGQVLWQDSRLRQNRTYAVVTNSPTVTDANKAEAIQELAKAMAQTLHDRVFENF